MHELSRTDARRLAVRAQLLTQSRPAGLLGVVRDLTLLQWDATAAVAPNADLVVWSRLGSAYQPDELLTAREHGVLVELRGFVRPAEDVALYRAEMADWPDPDAKPWQRAQADWVAANDACRRDILARLEESAPLAAGELPDTCVRPWKSSGWNNDRNVQQLLELMEQRGEVAVAARRRGARLWDLASRVLPDDAAMPLAEASRRRAELRLRSLGIARSKAVECPVEPQDVGEVGESAVIEDVRGSWRIDPSWLDEPFEERVALLSPLDRLIFDRKRMVDLFAFDYQLEMYKPKAKRRWGYFALPILEGDRFVGKVDATTDRKAGVLRVDAIHEDEAFSSRLMSAVNDELEDLARWLEVDLLVAR